MSKINFGRLLVYLFFILIGFFIGYLSKESKVITSIKKKDVAKQELPECFLGRCPQYFSMDVDGDDLAESLVIIPTAMTKGAGKLWIIDEGKVIFKTGEMMQISVKQSAKDAEAGNRFTLLYAEKDEPNKIKEVNYIYKNGQFKPEKYINKIKFLF